MLSILLASQQCRHGKLTHILLLCAQKKQTHILTQVRSKRIMSPGQDRNACMASVGYICLDVRTISTKFRFYNGSANKMASGVCKNRTQTCLFAGVPPQ
jgi:hypothetical protein